MATTKLEDKSRRLSREPVQRQPLGRQLPVDGAGCTGNRLPPPRPFKGKHPKQFVFAAANTSPGLTFVVFDQDVRGTGFRDGFAEPALEVFYRDILRRDLVPKFAHYRVYEIHTPDLQTKKQNAILLQSCTTFEQP